MGKVSVRYSRKFNTGNYESLEISASLEDGIEDEESILEAFERVSKLTRFHLRSEIAALVPKRSCAGSDSDI